MKKHAVYLLMLLNPETLELMGWYVGKTDTPLRRAREHLRQSHNEDIALLLKQGCVPELRWLNVGLTEQEALDREVSLMTGEELGLPVVLCLNKAGMEDAERMTEPAHKEREQNIAGLLNRAQARTSEITAGRRFRLLRLAEKSVRDWEHRAVEAEQEYLDYQDIADKATAASRSRREKTLRRAEAAAENAERVAQGAMNAVIRLHRLRNSQPR